MDVERDSGLQNTLPSGMSNMQFLCRRDLLIIHVKCRWYGLHAPGNAAGVNSMALLGLNTICKLHKALICPAEVHALVWELDIKVPVLFKSNTATKASTGALI